METEGNTDGAMYNSNFEEFGAKLQAQVLSTTEMEAHSSIDPTIDAILVFVIQLEFMLTPNYEVLFEMFF